MRLMKKERQRILNTKQTVCGLHSDAFKIINETKLFSLIFSMFSVASSVFSDSSEENGDESDQEENGEGK